MSKRRKSSQFSKARQNPPSAKKSTPPNPGRNTSSPVESSPPRVQPEQMSLTAHAHIQVSLQKYHKTHLEQEDLNAVLRLSQHLRIFGLLSAVGYINQTNDQEGKVRQRTGTIWGCLLGELIAPTQSLSNEELMEIIVKTAKENPSEYMAMWRKSLSLSHHWNFWARAYCQD